MDGRSNGTSRRIAHIHTQLLSSFIPAHSCPPTHTSKEGLCLWAIRPTWMGGLPSQFVLLLLFGCRWVSFLGRGVGDSWVAVTHQRTHAPQLHHTFTPVSSCHKLKLLQHCTQASTTPISTSLVRSFSGPFSLRS